MKLHHSKTHTKISLALCLSSLTLMCNHTVAQNETIQGALTVEDDVILKDRDLGSLTETARLSFEEDVPNGANSINLLYSWQSEKGGWTWGYTGASGYWNTDWTSMFLADDHVLTLYNTDPTATYGNAASIVLNPGDGTVDPSIMVGSDKVLTEGNGAGLLANTFVPINGAGSSDSFLMEGSYGGTGTIPREGAGTRMMWYPEKAAFRVGTASTYSWEDASIGNHSVAMGYQNSAAGSGSFASGSWSSATGQTSVAMGSSVHANGKNSVAMGFYNQANGDYAVAMGANCDALGTSSVAMGQSDATGDWATAMGFSRSDGVASVALGYAKAFADFSVAMGYQTTAEGYASAAIGSFNEIRTNTAGETAWQGDDQNSVFEVGIGTSASNRKNGLTVLQDGSVEIGKDAGDASIPLKVSSDGTITLAKPQGDISMGVFGQ